MSGTRSATCPAEPYPLVVAMIAHLLIFLWTDDETCERAPQ